MAATASTRGDRRDHSAQRLFSDQLGRTEAIAGLRELEAIIEWCHRQGVRNVVLKLGAVGLLVSDGTRKEHIAGHQVNAVDGTGAVDCFARALLARMAAGGDFSRALHYANAGAALTTTGYGAVTPLPRPDAVRHLLSGDT